MDKESSIMKLYAYLLFFSILAHCCFVFAIKNPYDIFFTPKKITFEQKFGSCTHTITAKIDRTSNQYEIFYTNSVFNHTSGKSYHLPINQPCFAKMFSQAKKCVIAHNQFKDWVCALSSEIDY